MNCPQCSNPMIVTRATAFGEDYHYCRACKKEAKELIKTEVKPHWSIEANGATDGVPKFFYAGNILKLRNVSESVKYLLKDYDFATKLHRLENLDNGHEFCETPEALYSDYVCVN